MSEFSTLPIDVYLSASILNHYNHRGKNDWSVVEVQTQQGELKFVVANAEEHGYENNPHAFTEFEAKAIARALLRGER